MPSLYTKLFFLFSILMLMQSCNRTMYTPNMQNSPMLKEKGELRVNVSTDNYQAAYGIFNHVGIMVNVHNPNLSSFSEFTEDLSGNKYLVEGGLGVFIPMKETGVFEIYAGGGQGFVSFDNRNDMLMDRFSTRFERYFVQPSIGVTGDIFEVSFSLRYVHLRFYNLDTSEYVYDELNGSDQDLSTINADVYRYLEPAVTFKIGRKCAKAFFQIQRSNQLNSALLRHRKEVFIFGIHLNLAKRHDDSKK